MRDQGDIEQVAEQRRLIEEVRDFLALLPPLDEPMPPRVAHLLERARLDLRKKVHAALT